MIDLTNKSVDEINGLIQKYAQVLETVLHKEQPYLAYIIDIAINHIEANHKNVNSDRKAWAVVAVRYRNKSGKIKKESDIIETIDEFLKYIEDEFQSYAGMMIPVSQHDLEAGFLHQFLIKKNR
jgi:hypothetical protein